MLLGEHQKTKQLVGEELSSELKFQVILNLLPNIIHIYYYTVFIPVQKDAIRKFIMKLPDIVAKTPKMYIKTAQMYTCIYVRIIESR